MEEQVVGSAYEAETILRKSFSQFFLHFSLFFSKMVLGKLEKVRHSLKSDRSESISKSRTNFFVGIRPLTCLGNPKYCTKLKLCSMLKKSKVLFGYLNRRSDKNFLVFFSLIFFVSGFFFVSNKFKI